MAIAMAWVRQTWPVERDGSLTGYKIRLTGTINYDIDQTAKYIHFRSLH